MELLKQVSTEEGKMCPCPRLCGGSINLVLDPTIVAMSTDKRLRDPILLTGTELYQAVNGMGLPDEIPKDPIVVQSLLKSSAIAAVVVEEVNGKIYLHEMILDTGVTIHLGSGQRGAQIIKLTKERVKNGPPSPS